MGYLVVGEKLAPAAPGKTHGDLQRQVVGEVDGYAIHHPGCAVDWTVSLLRCSPREWHQYQREQGRWHRVDAEQGIFLAHEATARYLAALVAGLEG